MDTEHFHTNFNSNNFVRGSAHKTSENSEASQAMNLRPVQMLDHVSRRSSLLYQGSASGNVAADQAQKAASMDESERGG